MSPKVFKSDSTQNLANFILFVEHVNKFNFIFMDLYIYQLLSFLRRQTRPLKLIRKIHQGSKSTLPDRRFFISPSKIFYAP